MSITAKQIQAAESLAVAIAETVREAREIPAGKVFAPMCDLMSATAFDGLVAALGGAGLVERKGDLLRWVGPELS